MKIITLVLALGLCASCFAQSILSPAQENWLTEKEAKELAAFRKVRPDSVVVRFDFLTENATRIVTTPVGVTYTFVGALAPKEWKLPVPLWTGVDKATGVYMDVTPTDAFIYAPGRMYMIHALGDGLSLISEAHIAEQIKRDKTREQGG